MQAQHSKVPCQQCGTNLEFPFELSGQTIECPSCNQPTLLQATATETLADEDDAQTAGITAPELLALFSGPIARPRASFLYTIGLGVVTFAMVLLPIIYVALICLA